jgi:methyl-accepting chemotaxis protein
MGNKLGAGSRIIRLLLLLGIALALFGGCTALWIAQLSGDKPEIRHFALMGAAIFVFEGVTFLAVFAMLAARKLLKRVNLLAEALNRSAEGDLKSKVEISAEDELGLLYGNFNTMQDRLAAMAGRVKVAIRELGRVADDIGNVSRRGKSAAEIQFDGVSGASMAVDEINHSVNDVARAVEGLSSLNRDNFSSIVEMTTSIESTLINVDALSKIIEEVSTAIIRLASAEQQIAGGVSNLMEDSLSTASLVAEMDRTIKHVEKSAQQTAAISATVKNDAEEGREAVEATISGIGEIHRTSHITSEAIDNLTVRAGDIGRILLVIDELASQTNLLALNASIIAAQAGEHGKGFAVVAEEIKGLAKRTTLSTREISEIIDGVREETKRAVKALAMSAQRIDEGERLSQRSGTALKKIVDSVQMTTSQVEEIARSTALQSEQSQTMRRSMERVAEMVRQIANATRDQEQGSNAIMAAVERMTELSCQVLASIREQGKAGSNVVRSAEDVSGKIDNIRHACSVQTGSSRRIVDEMGNIKDSTQTTMEHSRMMEEVVSALSLQIDLLKEEMSGFKI